MKTGHTITIDGVTMATVTGGLTILSLRDVFCFPTNLQAFRYRNARQGQGRKREGRKDGRRRVSQESTVVAIITKLPPPRE